MDVFTDRRNDVEGNIIPLTQTPEFPFSDNLIRRVKPALSSCKTILAI